MRWLNSHKPLNGVRKPFHQIDEQCRLTWNGRRSIDVEFVPL